MKKFYKILGLLLALSAFSFGFIACSSDDDDDDGPSVSASYATTNEITEDGETYTLIYTLNFYSDKTYHCCPINSPNSQITRGNLTEDWVSVAFFHSHQRTISQDFDA